MVGRMRRSTVLLPFAVFLVSAPLRAATLPYFENFDDDPVGTLPPSELAPELGAFVESADSAWTVISDGIDGQSYRNVFTTDNTPTSTGINFSGVLGGPADTAQSFTLSIDFRFNGGTSANSTVGLGFLGSSNAFNPGYFVDLNYAQGGSMTPAGQLRFVENGGIISGAIDAGTPTIGVVYKLTLSGLYVDSNGDEINDRLDLTASISGGTDSSALSGTITFNDPTPQAGTWFGIRNRNNVGDLNVDFDNFSVAAVPEPASAALVLLGGVSLIFRRRSRV